MVIDSRICEYIAIESAKKKNDFHIHYAFIMIMRGWSASGS